ncbi:MAG: 3-deoxy-7-phosphoheptulonate synthase, partial [Candidatus Omnitrophota bacterium]
MSFTYLHKIPTPAEISRQMPMPEKLKKVKAARDRDILRVLKNLDRRMLLIVGPCSADDEDALCEYTVRLRRLQ